MRTSWHNILGCGRGPVARLTPQVRIMAGVALFAACMVAPATTMPGVAIIAATVLLWAVVCGPPVPVVRSVVLFGLAIFLPYFLLVPLMRTGEIGWHVGWRSLLVAPWGVFLHGIAGMLVSVCTATTLGPSDLRKGVLSLPVPRLVAGILLQIIHQTSELVYETNRMAAAISIRGASTGWRTSISVLLSIPKVWLPRLLVRADRVAAAMEVRGYCEGDPVVLGGPSFAHADVTAVLGAGGILVLAIVLRLGGKG